MPDADKRENMLPVARSWSRSGALLYQLSRDLGGLGIVLVLPNAVSRSVWESHLVSTAPRYDEAVRHLRASGLCTFAESSGAYKAGLRIGESLGLVRDGVTWVCPA